MKAPGPIIFSIKGFKNPPTTVPIYFDIEIYHRKTGENAGDYLINKALSPFEFIGTTGSIDVLSIAPNETAIYASDGFYEFKIKPEHDVEPTYQFSITFPVAFDLLNSAGCNVDGLGSQVSCIADAANRVITLGQVVDATVKGGTEIIFKVNSIKNPGNYDAPGRVDIDMRTATGSVIDLGNFDLPANLYKATNILSFSCYAGDTMAGATSVSYFFRVIPR